MLGCGMIPVSVIHVRTPAQTRVCLGRWASPVVVIAPDRTIVVVPGHCGCGIVYSRLPVRTVQCGTIAAHTRH